MSQASVGEAGFRERGRPVWQAAHTLGGQQQGAGRAWQRGLGWGQVSFGVRPPASLLSSKSSTPQPLPKLSPL